MPGFYKLFACPSPFWFNVSSSPTPAPCLQHQLFGTDSVHRLRAAMSSSAGASSGPYGNKGKGKGKSGKGKGGKPIGSDDTEQHQEPQLPELRLRVQQQEQESRELRLHVQQLEMQVAWMLSTLDRVLPLTAAAAPSGCCPTRRREGLRALSAGCPGLQHLDHAALSVSDEGLGH